MQTTTTSDSPASVGRRHSVKKVAGPATAALLCLAISALAVTPFFFMGRAEDGQSRWHPRLPDTHDMFLHLDQMKSFYQGLKAGEIYPRWEIETNRGFGAPTTSFYPPGVYYVTGFFYFLTHRWVRTLFLAELAMMIASAAAMYFYARRNMSATAALVAMGLYAVMPYHLIDQYHRGAIAELLSFVWMPLLLLFIEKAFESGSAALVPTTAAESYLTESEVEPTSVGEFNTPSKKIPASPAQWLASSCLAVVGIAISYGGFIWSHPPTAYQFSLALALAIPFLAIVTKNWRGILLSGAGIALGVGLAAAYIYPASAEKNLITNEYIARTWPYHQSYVFVKSDYYGDNPAYFILLDRTWILNVAIILVGTAVAMFVASRLKGSGYRPSRAKVILWAIIGCFAAFMMTTASYRLGAKIPMIEIGVFSWRMLGITSFAGSLIVGALAQYAFDASIVRRSIKWLSASVATVVILGAIVFNLTAVFGPIYNENLFEPEAEHFNYAMLPRTAPDDPEDFPRDVPEAELDGDEGQVSVDVWKPQHREIRATLPDFDELYIRTFNYPGWTATVDGKPAAINTGEDYGDIEIDLDGGSHSVVLDYLDTPVRRRARLATIYAALFTAVLLLAGLALTLKSRSRPSAS